MIESPTGLGIRNDSEGFGHYGAPRGGRRHEGTDFECIPGQVVKCPIDDATVVRSARPYRDDAFYSGVVVENARIRVKMFYCKPFPGLIGKKVRCGQGIAEAQDISKKYSDGMTPHIHLQIDAVDPTLLIEMSDLIASLKSTLKKTA